MSEKNEENIYLELLKGRRSCGRYKNSNLFIVDTSQKSIEERTKNNISPPTNLNPDYSFSDYGLLKTSNALLSADFRLGKVADAAGIEDAAQITINTMPMRTIFKSKELYINDTLITTSTNSDHFISYIRHLATEVRDGVEDSKNINIIIPDTAGHFDAIDHIGDGADGVVNHGTRERQRLFNDGATVRVIDILDTLCFSENGADRYVPSDFDIKLILTRNNKNKILYGTDALGRTTNLHISDFTLKIPMFKPTQQLGAAINKLMIEGNEECRYYSTHYRFVARQVAHKEQSENNDEISEDQIKNISDGDDTDDDENDDDNIIGDIKNNKFENSDDNFEDYNNEYSEDESMSDESNNASDNESEENEELMKRILQQLLTINKF